MASVCVMPKVKLNMNRRVPFDRTNPNPPKYLYSLRNVGHWRRIKHQGTSRELSTALRKLSRDKWLDWQGNWWLPENRGCVLDAGCGHSSDAYFAMKRFGFTEGIKVDLFPPYWDYPYFREKQDKFEKHSVKFVQGDICKLTDIVPSASVDLMVCNAVLDLMDAQDRNLFYGEAFEVMRPGGILTIVYQWLVNGHNDWKDGGMDWCNAIMQGFHPLDLAQSSMTLQRPLAEATKEPTKEGV